MASIFEDTDRYEAWLRKQCEVVEKGLQAKHKRMRKSAFDFLRATYYRWALSIETVCPGFSNAPSVLCVGDIHIENYGTWRDGDGRTVWGVNDFDEAAVMPYPYDLVRLVASALLAPQIRLDANAVARAILAGYKDGLSAPGPVLLDQGDAWLRAQVARLNDTTGKFWRGVDKCKAAKPPSGVKKALTGALPGPEVANLRFAKLQKGGGGLGRPRFLAVCDWQGGRVVREAKAWVPSAWDWARDTPHPRTHFLELAAGRFRSPDATVSFDSNHVLRRVSPDARKLNIEDLVPQGLGVPLLRAMGRELGSIHAAHRNAPRCQTTWHGAAALGCAMPHCSRRRSSGRTTSATRPVRRDARRPLAL